MTKRFYKHKLLLDENFPARSFFPLLNHRFDVKHVAMDLNLGSLSDPKIFALAQRKNRLLVTYNTKDFVKLVEKNTKTGLIGVSANLPPDQVDKKLTALLSKSGSRTLFGKITFISGETK